MSDKTYIAVFFDVHLSATPEEARQIRVDRKKYKSLLDEAIPGKIIELEDRYGCLGSFTIVSRRSFYLKSNDTMFLICDVKGMSYVSELAKWLSEQKGVEMINKFFYRIYYNEKWCAASVTVTPDYEELTIRPNLQTHDIGNGPGAAVYKKFKRI